MTSPGIEQFRGYPVLVRKIPVRSRTYEIVGPANYEQLIDDPRVIQRFAQDEFLPYWAEFWPATRVLADIVADWPAPPADQSPPTVFELGCGLGLVGLVAAARGYRAILSDYDEDSLAFVQESARRNGVSVETRFIDWRQHYADLRPNILLAAEVLYENRNGRPIAEFIRSHLAVGGEAIIVDAFRRPADAFPAIAMDSGLRVDIGESEWTPPDGGKTIRARLFRVRRIGE